MGATLGKAPIFLTSHFEKSFGLARPWGSEPPAGSNQPHDQQQHDGADRGIDDLRYKPGTEADAKSWKQQTGEQRAGDADKNIADDPKAGAPHDLSGQPACNQADEQNNEKAFVGHAHG